MYRLLQAALTVRHLSRRISHIHHTPIARCLPSYVGVRCIQTTGIPSPAPVPLSESMWRRPVWKAELTQNMRRILADIGRLASLAAKERNAMKKEKDSHHHPSDYQMIEAEQWAPGGTEVEEQHPTREELDESLVQLWLMLAQPAGTNTTTPAADANPTTLPHWAYLACCSYTIEVCETHGLYEHAVLFGSLLLQPPTWVSVTHPLQVPADTTKRILLCAIKSSSDRSVGWKLALQLLQSMYARRLHAWTFSTDATIFDAMVGFPTFTTVSPEAYIPFEVHWFDLPVDDAPEQLFDVIAREYVLSAVEMRLSPHVLPALALRSLNQLGSHPSQTELKPIHERVRAMWTYSFTQPPLQPEGTLILLSCFGIIGSTPVQEMVEMLLRVTIPSNAPWRTPFLGRSFELVYNMLLDRSPIPDRVPFDKLRLPHKWLFRKYRMHLAWLTRMDQATTQSNGLASALASAVPASAAPVFPPAEIPPDLEGVNRLHALLKRVQKIYPPLVVTSSAATVQEESESIEEPSSSTTSPSSIPSESIPSTLLDFEQELQAALQQHPASQQAQQAESIIGRMDSIGVLPSPRICLTLAGMYTSLPDATAQAGKLAVLSQWMETHGISFPTDGASPYQTLLTLALQRVAHSDASVADHPGDPIDDGRPLVAIWTTRAQAAGVWDSLPPSIHAQVLHAATSKPPTPGAFDSDSSDSHDPAYTCCLVPPESGIAAHVQHLFRNVVLGRARSCPRLEQCQTAIDAAAATQKTTYTTGAGK